ncbi:phosphoglucomutase/phosphomannomutase family protein [Halobaculum sp. WSA2]|uniref:Phosphoglucomutase/phosphomannomutase family protein n=1 Tax=Halobaculum saliterrae TaxID=2073113 RepID=A0A6B0SSZ4_9EURY|nr:phosphoglucomutase/phosphomannomutase family protein [Halobaculum saliterrae]MXR41677.1 phosphoglucomutase/phosphomannomutase family protein [Halobaculum saliterrae]
MDEISFGTDGWRATLDTFTDRRVRIVGQAVADTLAESEADAAAADATDRPVLVGYDARPTSEGFAESLAEVLAGNGFDVLLPERDCPTPLVAHAIVERDAAGAMMVTASHNPPEYNGVKFIPEDGAPALPEVTERIEANLREPDLAAAGTPDEGAIDRVDLVTPHAEHARDLVARGDGALDLSGLTVAYDAMHGSGRGVTDALLESAGAAVERIRCERDPEFGGGSPEPSAKNLEELAERVTEGGADLGIANDGDADRLAIVTPERGHLDENLFFAATYDHLLEDDSGPAIRTVSTTFLIDRIAEAHGEAVYETAVGFKWVAQAMGEHDALMGGEESGGFSVRGHVREKDGVLMALLAAVAASEESYDDRVDRLEDEHGRIVADKVSVDCPDSEKERVIDDLADHIPDEVAGESVADVVTVDGFKLLLADGSWLLVRPSGTEPKMRVYAESGSEADTAAILADGRELVEPLV